MSNYLLFGYHDFYPFGGMNDCQRVFAADSDEQAIAASRKIIQGASPYDNWELARLTTDGWIAVYSFGSSWPENKKVTRD